MFEALWRRHPPALGTARLFGREVTMHRYQQAFGADYAFSGQLAQAAPLTEDAAPEVFFVKEELRRMLSASGSPLREWRYEACLVNWYDGGGSIGAHADDEHGLVPGSPIFAVSWGETRTFRVTPRLRGAGAKVDLELGDGDVVVMGGACQRTHKLHSRARRARSQEAPWPQDQPDVPMLQVAAGFRGCGRRVTQGISSTAGDLDHSASCPSTPLPSFIPSCLPSSLRSAFHHYLSLTTSSGSHPLVLLHS
ncbi:unnamed protein product, partial [Prorocentrum cordatum]